MRKWLDRLYQASAVLAGLSMIGVFAMVSLTIASRLFGFSATGSDAYAGYATAGAGFMALAATLKKGEHIRVTLLLSALQGRARRALELWALAAATLLALLWACYACRLAWQSHAFADISTGNDATPLWIPQLGMAVGSAVFAIAFVDEFVLELLGRRVTPADDGEMLHNE